MYLTGFYHIVITILVYMSSITVPHDKIVNYTENFPRFLELIACPIAVYPPALSELLGNTVSAGRIRESLLTLGFKEVRSISDNLGDLYGILAREAKKTSEKPLLFTACPDIASLLQAEYPALAQRFSAAMPPADRAILDMKKNHANATIFFISPCSQRASALRSLIDYAIPLETIFPALLERLKKDSNTLREQVKSPIYSRHLIKSRELTREFLNVLDGRNIGCNPADSVIEFIACKAGCFRGDWAPKV